MASPNKKRLFINVVLLVVASALAAFVFYFKVPTNNQKILYDKTIGEQVNEVLIHSEGLPDTVLKNIDGVWKVIKPETFIADNEKVTHLFTLLSENAETRYDIAGKDLASYALDKDNLSVSFNQVKYIFGKLNQVSQKRYILRGDKMYLISETVYALIKSGANGFKKDATK